MHIHCLYRLVRCGQGDRSTMRQRRGSRRALSSKMGRSIQVLLLIVPELHQQRSGGVAFLVPFCPRLDHPKPNLVLSPRHASSSSLWGNHPFLPHTDCATLGAGARVGSSRGRGAWGGGIVRPSVSALPALLQASNAEILFASRGASAKPTLVALADAMRLVAKTLHPVLVYLWVMFVRVVRAVSPSAMEVKLGLRLAVAAAVGMAIGLERRTSHRPAGVRTM